MGQLFRQFLRKSGYTLPLNEEEVRRKHERCIDPTQVNDLDSLIASLVVLREAYGNLPLAVATLKASADQAPQAALDKLEKAVHV